MIHGLAAQSGGTLSLTSAPGEGTAAGLWPPPRDDGADTVSRDEREPIAAPRAATVVLVDDEELVRTGIAGMLRDIGYSVIEFGSANQALDAFRTGTEADALVTDYLMPGMTGGALVSELRGSGIRIPSLLDTGYTAAGKDVPANVPRLAKPFRQVDLAARLDELIRRFVPPSARLRAVE